MRPEFYKSFPDACIAWSGEKNSIDGLEEALDRWFIPSKGEPAMQRSEYHFP